MLVIPTYQLFNLVMNPFSQANRYCMLYEVHASKFPETDIPQQLACFSHNPRKKVEKAIQAILNLILSSLCVSFLYVRALKTYKR
jgi:hypothetical protein